MAYPRKQADPSQGNRAATIRIGTPEPEKLDLASLEENAIIADMAEVVSEGNVVPDPEPAAPVASTEPEQASQPPAAPEATTEAAPADDVDDPRFKGKSKAELYKAYQNLERLKGEHDSELGNYRKLFMDNVLKPQFEKPQTPAATEPPTNSDEETALLNEMLNSPSSFKRKTVQQAKDELLKELTGVARMSEIQQAKAAKQAVIETPEFAQWLTTNVPQHVAATADTDLSTFNFIMKSYELATGQTAQAAPAQPTPAPDRRIPIGPAAGVPAASAASPGAKPVIFKQAELAEMMLYRPEEYARRQPEILAAYREGRIK